MQAKTLAALQQARSARKPIVLATRLSDAAETLIYPDRVEGAQAGDATLVAAARRALGTGKSETIDVGSEKIFLNVYVPPPRLDDRGRGPYRPDPGADGDPARIRRDRRRSARRLGNRQRFPGVKVIKEWADEAFQAMGLDVSTAVVTLTHDPKLDDPALEVALKSDAFYIGALGSRKTHAKRKERLAEVGITDEMFARVHGPVGLNIGAKSPAEIAVSILGQIIEVRPAVSKRSTAPKVVAA